MLVSVHRELFKTLRRYHAAKDIQITVYLLMILSYFHDGQRSRIM